MRGGERGEGGEDNLVVQICTVHCHLLLSSFVRVLALRIGDCVYL